LIREADVYGCVALNAEATRVVGRLKELAEGCDRLVHSSVVAADRGRHRRLLCCLLAAPFLLAPAVMLIGNAELGLAVAVAGLCATFGLTWLFALVTSATGAWRATAGLALAATAVVSALGLYTFGPSAPIAVLLVAMPLEAWWIDRSRHAFGLGVGAAALAAGAATISGIGTVGTPGLLWLLATLYGATLAWRWAPRGEERTFVPLAAGRSLPEDCFNAVTLVLSRSGEIEHASDQARDLLGVEPELLLGSGFVDRLHVADRVTLLHAVSIVREDGKARHANVRCRMPRTSDGKAAYHPFEVEIVSTGPEAVSVLLRSGAELAALHEELAQARESVNSGELAKSRFLAAVSHELRTPLNAIIGFSEMLQHPDISGPLDRKQGEHVEMIRQAGSHLLSVVNSILDVSKIEAGTYQLTIEPFDLTTAVELCRNMLEPQAQAKNVTLSTKVSRGIGEVAGDQRAVQQILINLISNAIKFTPEDGRVSVEAVRSGDQIRLFVNDTGIGIAEEDLRRIGQPFVQVRNDYTRQFQGTGLGLSLVKGLVELHGGSMSIESAPDLGTTVTIGLPAARHSDIEFGDKGNSRELGTADGSPLRKIA